MGHRNFNNYLRNFWFFSRSITIGLEIRDFGKTRDTENHFLLLICHFFHGVLFTPMWFSSHLASNMCSWCHDLLMTPKTWLKFLQVQEISSNLHFSCFPLLKSRPPYLIIKNSGWIDKICFGLPSLLWTTLPVSTSWDNQPVTRCKVHKMWFLSSEISWNFSKCQL